MIFGATLALLLLAGTGPANECIRINDNGVTYRLRLMNVTIQNGGFRFELSNARGPVRWVQVAKDGWELPEHRRVISRADQRVTIGETFDFEFTPNRTGDHRFAVLAGNGRTVMETTLQVVE